jgi:hypothetical protein
MDATTHTNKTTEAAMKTNRIEAGMYEAKFNGFTVLISKLVYETTYWTFDILADDDSRAEFCRGAYETKREAVNAAQTYIAKL